MANVTRLVPTRSAEVLGECQRMASDRLPGSLKTVLDKVDDALFELANKADSSQRQNLYFDAMRELRLKRDSFEADFLASFNHEFENSIDLDKAKRHEAMFAQELELSLVESDEVEETLALTNFVESMKSHCKEQLFGLDRRMSYLLSQPDIGDGANPLGPHVIGSAFRSACQQLESDIEVKLTLFKMFDKFAAVGINQLYADVNDHLIRSDVLPKISSSPVRSSGGRTRVIIESNDEHVEATGPDVFSTLQNLMSSPGAPLGGGSLLGGSGGGFAPGIGGGAGTGGGGAYAGSAGIVAGGGAGGGGGAAALGTASLVNTLTMLQQGDVSALQVGGGSAPIDANQIEAGTVNVLRTIRESGRDRARRADGRAHARHRRDPFRLRARRSRDPGCDESAHRAAPNPDAEGRAARQGVVLEEITPGTAVARCARRRRRRLE